MPTGLRVLKKAAWKPLSSEFGDLIERLRAGSEKIEKEAMAAHFVESSQGREEIRQGLRKIDSNQITEHETRKGKCFYNTHLSYY
jgi:hypothetical protein